MLGFELRPSFELVCGHREPGPPLVNAWQRGLALVTVLWVPMLLALIAASFTRTTRTEINLTRNLIDNAKALADAGVYRAVYGLLAPDQGPPRPGDREPAEVRALIRFRVGTETERVFLAIARGKKRGREVPP